MYTYGYSIDLDSLDQVKLGIEISGSGVLPEVLWTNFVNNGGPDNLIIAFENQLSAQEEADLLVLIDLHDPSYIGSPNIDVKTVSGGKVVQIHKYTQEDSPGVYSGLAEVHTYTYSGNKLISIQKDKTYADGVAYESETENYFTDSSGKLIVKRVQNG